MRTGDAIGAAERGTDEDRFPGRDHPAAANIVHERAGAMAPASRLVSVVCPACQSPQEIDPKGEPRCVACGKTLSGTVGVAVVPKIDAGALALDTPDEWLMDAFAALVPGLGLVRVARSGALSGGRRAVCGVVALASTALLALGLWRLSAPRPAPPPPTSSEVVHRQIAAIETLALAYRKRTGHLPDAAAWRMSVETADSNLRDPWGRPYRYTADGNRFSVETLGADGQAGGSGADADVIERFEAPAEARP